MRNNAITVQRALISAAHFRGSVPLEQIVKDVEESIGIGINLDWAAEALRSGGFRVGVTDRLVTFIAEPGENSKG